MLEIRMAVYHYLRWSIAASCSLTSPFVISRGSSKIKLKQKMLQREADCDICVCWRFLVVLTGPTPQQDIPKRIPLRASLQTRRYRQLFADLSVSHLLRWICGIRSGEKTYEFGKTLHTASLQAVYENDEDGFQESSRTQQYTCICSMECFTCEE